MSYRDPELNYLAECRQLSITARLGLALVCFDEYCKVQNLDSSMISIFSDYMWHWPIIDGPDQFDPWEQAKPELVSYGLGDGASEDMRKTLALTKRQEHDFRILVENTVEILWGSFWGAAEDETSLDNLQTVVSLAGIRPPLTPFRFSRFESNDGWGNAISTEDRNYWRNCMLSSENE